MRGPLVAFQTLRGCPEVHAVRTDSAGLESVPTMTTFSASPGIFLLRFPTALRTPDFRACNASILLHTRVNYLIGFHNGWEYASGLFCHTPPFSLK